MDPSKAEEGQAGRQSRLEEGPRGRPGGGRNSGKPRDYHRDAYGRGQGPPSGSHIPYGARPPLHRPFHGFPPAGPVPMHTTPGMWGPGVLAPPAYPFPGHHQEPYNHAWTHAGAMQANQWSQPLPAAAPPAYGQVQPYMYQPNYAAVALGEQAEAGDVPPLPHQPFALHDTHADPGSPPPPPEEASAPAAEAVKEGTDVPADTPKPDAEARATNAVHSNGLPATIETAAPAGSLISDVQKLVLTPIKPPQDEKAGVNETAAATAEDQTPTKPQAFSGFSLSKKSLRANPRIFQKQALKVKAAAKRTPEVASEAQPAAKDSTSEANKGAQATDSINKPIEPVNTTTGSSQRGVKLDQPVEERKGPRKKTRWGVEIQPTELGEPGSPEEAAAIGPGSPPLSQGKSEKGDKARRRLRQWQERHGGGSQQPQASVQRSSSRSDASSSRSRSPSSRSSRSSRSSASRSSHSRASSSDRSRVTPPRAPQHRQNRSQSPDRAAYNVPAAPRREDKAVRWEPSQDYRPRYNHPMLARRRGYERGYDREHERDRHRRSPSYDRDRRSPSYSTYRARDRDRDRGRVGDRDREYYRRHSRERRSPSPRHHPQSSYQDDRRRGTGRQGQAYAPQISRDLSPEDGEVRSVSPPSRRDSATPPTMDVYPLSPKLAKADNLLLSSGDAFMPPLPTGPSPYPQFQQTRPQEPGLAEQAAQLEAKCQAALDEIYSERGLDRTAEVDPYENARMSLRLLDFANYGRGYTKHPPDLVLTFDFNPEEERAEVDKDSLACLGDPSALGFPSWVPSVLTAVDHSLTPEIEPWVPLEACPAIPFETTVQPEDPRTQPGSGSVLRLALPPFALLPESLELPSESNSYSWSEAPPADLRDDGLSAGPDFSQGAGSTDVPPPPPPEPSHDQPASIPPPWLQPTEAPAIEPPIPAAQAAVPPLSVSQATQLLPTIRPRHSNPKEGTDWLALNSHGQFSEQGSSLHHLQQRLGRIPELPKGACVHRRSDNLWLPLKEGLVTEDALVWRGQEMAADVASIYTELVNQNGADVLDHESLLRTPEWDDQRLESLGRKKQKPAPEAHLDGDASDALPDQALGNWLDLQHLSVCEKLRRWPKMSGGRRKRAWRRGKSGPCWGPGPPLNVGAMLRGRLALRTLGGKEGEILAARVIEDAFSAVMAKEPARQAAIQVELKKQREAERAAQQASAQRMAEKKKQEEDKRIQEKLEDARMEAQRAGRRAAEREETKRLQAAEHRERHRKRNREPDCKRSQEPDRRLSREPDRRQSREPEHRRSRESDRRRNREPAHRTARANEGSRIWEPDMQAEIRSKQHEQREEITKSQQVASTDRLAFDEQQEHAAPSRPGATGQQKDLHAPNGLDAARPAYAGNSEDAGPSTAAKDPQQSHPGKRQGASSDSDPELSSESSPELPKARPKRKRGRPAREQPRQDDLDDDYDPGSTHQARGSKRQSRGKIDAPSRKAQKASEMNASPIRAEEPCTAEEEEEETTISDKQAEVRAALMKKAVPEILQAMLRALQKYDRNELNSLFADPVSKKDYPTYLDHISKPMDLKTLGKKLKEIPATLGGLGVFREHLLRISSNAQKFAEVLPDADLAGSAALFREKAEAVYQQGQRDIENYGNSFSRGVRV